MNWWPLLLFSLLSCVQLFVTHGLQHARLPCLSPSPGVCSNSCPSNQWCHPAISSSIIPFSSCLQSCPASGSFPMSQLFTSGGPSSGVLTSVLPMNIQGWLPLGFTGLISLLSKGLSRAFSSTTIQKHQFFNAQPSLWSSSHIHTWLLEKPQHWLWFFSFKWYIFKMTLLPGSSFPNCYVGLYIYLKDNYHCPPHSFGRSQWW